jgi:HxlR-like helix-turn-helix
MGTSLLAARLKHLEQYGIARRTALPGPGRSFAYQLGDRGEALMPVMAALVDWGAGLETPSDYADRAAWGMVAMRLGAPEEAAGSTHSLGMNHPAQREGRFHSISMLRRWQVRRIPSSWRTVHARATVHNASQGCGGSVLGSGG